MQKILCTGICFLFISLIAHAQTFRIKEGRYHAAVTRQDGIDIPFEIKITGQKKMFILNDTESIEVTDVKQKGDSLNFRMPVFESFFLSTIQRDGSLKGKWIKGTSGETQYWDFHTCPGISNRFKPAAKKNSNTVSGKWDIILTRPSTGYTREAMGDFIQVGNKLTGSVLTPSGDYRYLEGIMDGDSVKLSVFDGSHAYLFSGGVAADGKTIKGNFYSGFAGVEEFSAIKNDHAVPPEITGTVLKEGYHKLDFCFPDLAGNLVSIEDKQFENKVVVIQIMGSWCPNCMDETRYLSDYYKKNKEKGVEMIALAYEYSTDMERSRKSLSRFQKAFDVQYPMLITGVSITDSLRTEKTLPQISPIQVFPTTIYIGRDGNVKSIHTGFYGPGTGVYFEEFKKEFEGTIQQLLKKY